MDSLATACKLVRITSEFKSRGISTDVFFLEDELRSQWLKQIKSK